MTKGNDKKSPRKGGILLGLVILVIGFLSGFSVFGITLVTLGLILILLSSGR